MKHEHSAAAADWFKSSYSGDDSGVCVEVANLGTTVGVRDSKDTTIGHLAITKHAWATFVTHARAHATRH
ncbi:DUF397 domain-containing protein [Streptomyces apocyni]|uniref:DUF397 domain-containing protein n=1 Tax=Streptomyces apocyni TaxID=2654677 RepID=UPI0012E9FD7E|nr:DUF397 domain-containing protein [Streptomyces apocyni]